MSMNCDEGWPNMDSRKGGYADPEVVEKEIDKCQIRGGQIWSQKKMPFHVRYVTVGFSPDLLILLSDPREQGSVICTAEDGKWQYTPEQLQTKFDVFRYTCDGQLSKLIKDF